MIWTEIKTASGVQWEGHPDCDEHAIDIWPHENEGFSWCVVTADVMDKAPEGWSATRDDAERHAEASYEKWLSDKVDVAMGRKPIPWEEIDDEHDEEATALLLAELEVSLHALKEENAMLRERLEIRSQHCHNLRTMLESATDTERAAVVAWLLERGHYTAEAYAGSIERGEHRREEER